MFICRHSSPGKSNRLKVKCPKGPEIVAKEIKLFCLTDGSLSKPQIVYWENLRGYSVQVIPAIHVIIHNLSCSNFSILHEPWRIITLAPLSEKKGYFKTNKCEPETRLVFIYCIVGALCAMIHFTVGDSWGGPDHPWVRVSRAILPVIESGHPPPHHPQVWSPPTTPPSICDNLGITCLSPVIW